MSHLTKTKVALYLAVIFIAGSVTGAVFGWNGAHHHDMKPPSQGRICDRIRDRLRAELDLTPAQVQQLEPLLEKQAREIQAIHQRTIAQLDELIRTSNAEIANVLKLTPQQRDKLAAMETRRREFGDKHRPPGPPPE